jgi:thioredoxin-like negative regulator of GroEL
MLTKSPLYFTLTLTALWAATLATQAAEPATEHFAEGQTALAAGDFEAAFKAFASAAKLEPTNTTYRQEAALVRRVMMVRDRLPKLEDKPEWANVARSLHTYYDDHRVYGESLKLDRQLHKRLDNAESATLLGHTLIALNKDTEAAELLEPWTAQDKNVHARVLRSIALAHAKQLEPAEALAAKVDVPAECDPHLAFDAARMHTLLGNKVTAVETLMQCFKRTPPSRLDHMRTAAKKCADFTTIADGDAFAFALKTKSEVEESSCSSGTSCGACPNRSKCSSGESKEKKADTE